MRKSARKDDCSILCISIKFLDGVMEFLRAKNYMIGPHFLYVCNLDDDQGYHYPMANIRWFSFYRKLPDDFDEPNEFGI